MRLPPPNIQKWLTQDKSTCRVHSRLMLLQHITKTMFDVDEVFRLMREKGKTIHRLLADGDLGYIVKEKRKSYKDNVLLIEDLRKGIVADIDLYDGVNYNAKIINFPADKGRPMGGGHAVMFKGYNPQTASTYMANTWGGNSLQQFSLAFLTETMRRYFVFESVEPYIKPQTATVYNQNDTKWRQYRLGNSRLTLHSHGCLVFSLCTALEWLRGVVCRPEDAVKYWRFSSGYLLWHSTSFNGGKYMGTATPNITNIRAWTTQHRRAIAWVRNNSIDMHFVCISRVEGNTVYCWDSLAGREIRLADRYQLVSLRLMERD